MGSSVTNLKRPLQGTSNRAITYAKRNATAVQDTVEIRVMNRLFFRAVNQRAFWNSCI